MSSCGSLSEDRNPESSYRILDDSNDSSPYQAEIDRKLARAEVKCDALKRQLSQASCFETLLVAEDKRSQFWDLVTELHAEMLKFAS